MEYPRKKETRNVIRSMKPQNECEKYNALYKVANQADFSISLEGILFGPADPYSDYQLPMENIHSVSATSTHVFVLTKRLYVHILGLGERGHIVFPLKQISFWQTCRWSCLPIQNWIAGRIFRFLTPISR